MLKSHQLHAFLDKLICIFIFYCSEVVATRLLICDYNNNLSTSTDPPEIRRSLENVTVVRQGSSYSFIVEVYSHPSPSKFWWRLNDDEISTSDPSFVFEPLLISGNTSIYNLTITNARHVINL